VKVEQSGRSLKVTGAQGTLDMEVNPMVKVEMDDSGEQLNVINEKPNVRRNKQMHGTMRALIANMVHGVSKGFQKKMEIYGTGYSVKEQGGSLVLQVGFCHPVTMKIPEGVKASIDTPATRGNEVPARFTLTGPDKHVLGQFAANIRQVKPPEPYKGKGIRYADEQIRRKVGKAFATGAV
jgi:large subunit ribosomal protein L6